MVPLDSSYVGIAVSIAGNVLISISLNTQKLAHKRLSEDYHKQRSDSLDGNRDSKPNKRSHGLHTERTPLLSTAKTPKSPSSSKRRDLAVYAVQPARDSDNGAVCLADGEGNSDPILIRELPRPAEVVRDLAENGTELAIQEGPNGGIRRKWLEISDRQQDQTNPAENGVMQAASSSKRSDSLVSRSQDTLKRMIGKSDSKSSRSGRSFYASKLWWLGLCSMALGELGNFTSYAFAPASVVAPLGTTALIANCFIAPLMLHERFRKKDVLGIAFSIAGAVTIVLSSKSENKSFIRAVSQPAFFIYAFISLGLIVILIVLSRTRAGDKYLAVDILICALCGGFTVLSVKAFSSFLTQNFVECFKQWPTYPVLAVLALTAIMQIIYLNKALRRFESRVVVPTQFVSFTISAITGSAILYRDFEDVQLGKVVAFFLGCALVFVGVIFLTSSKHTHSDQHSAGDTSQSLTALESEGNDSSITASSIASQSRLLDGVAMSSHPPSTAATYNIASSPAKVGRVLRKYNSIGMLPSKAGAATSAVATPIRATRAPTLATSKLFSPGYLLIAGSGFGDISRDDSDEEHSSREPSEDLEVGLTREGSGSSSSSGSANIQRGGHETLLDPRTSKGENANLDSTQDEDEDYEPMTRSAVMRRSGTV